MADAGFFGHRPPAAPGDVFGRCPGGHALESFVTPHPRFNCDVCQARQPAGASMRGCRICDYDVCESCRCPGGHALESFVTPHPRFNCDVCQARQPAGASMRGCRICDYDVCESCCCPGGHPLASFVTPHAAYHCDVCHAKQPRGVRMHGCRECDYDKCSACARQEEAGTAEAGLNVQMGAMGVSGGGGAGGGGAGSGGRQEPVAEESIKTLPSTSWENIVPPCGCADFLRGSAAVRAACPRATIIADDCAAKAEELRWEDGLPAALDENQIVALAAYSHDSGAGQAGNLYFELNKALRKRDKEDRAALIDGWGGYMHYMMGAMAKLPRVEGVCYRGYPDKATAIAQYKAGRPIQWGAFASTSTDFGAAKSFTNQVTGIIFKITVTDGRDINAYSFFPAENEVLLSPDHHFHVSSAPYERDGFTIIDMVQDAGNTFVS